MPKNKQQATYYWIGFGVYTVVVLFLTSWLKQATLVPDDEPIRWRLVLMDIASGILAIAPVVGAAFKFPKFGREEVSSIVTEIGVEEAKARLQNPISETTASLEAAGVNLQELAKEIINQNELARRERVRRFKNGEIPEKGST